MTVRSLSKTSGIGSNTSVPGGFTAQETITATDATWSVPTLASPIVKVTVIGAGGGGGGSGTGTGGSGGTTTFNAGGAGTVTAAGGQGGFGGNSTNNGANGIAGFSAGNGGQAGGVQTTNFGTKGQGGKITIAYLDLTGISTVNVTIGAGGTKGDDTGDGGVGGAGEVIVEYVAG